ncbi:heparinase II/III family protein [Brachybacterium sp. GCM10030252]|uniref:heparinase II/III domain-containing protein n=1 Tax=Brachybacterium sp. GCM10030252 TaxID=3273380 RepID=UPI0036115618
MSLDFAVSERQAFGYAFRPEAVAELLGGSVTISPHPTWKLPAIIDWRADPFDDNNWRHQYHMLRWLDPLRRAAVSGNAEAFDMWIRYVRDWVEKNPSNRPRSPYAWKDMVDGIRALQLCVAAPLVRDRSPEDLEWLERAIADHLAWLSDPAHLGHSNHALHQHQALFVCARMLGDDAATNLAVSRLGELFTEQYDEQGVNAEGAIAYHYANRLWWEKVFRRLDVEDVARPPGAERLELAPEELAHATRPDGTFVSIGDTDGGSPRPVRTPVTDYVSSEGALGEPPENLVKVYDAGYLFARSGWGETEKSFKEETFYSVSFGRSDRVHGHPDGGSLTFSADTVNWVVDPGKYQYGKSIPRSHFLSHDAHSLAYVEGLPRRPGSTVTLTKRVVEPRFHHWMFDDDGYDGVRLRRHVSYSVSGDYLVVIDAFQSAGEITGVQRWQLGHEVTATVSRNHVALDAEGHHAALCFTGTATDLSTVRGRMEPFDGWVATGWKTKKPAPAVLARKHGTHFRFITVIAAGKGDHPRIETLPGARRGAVLLRVTTHRLSEIVEVSQDGLEFPLDLPDPDQAGTTPAAPQAAPRVGEKPSHLVPERRRELLELITEARRAGWEATPGGRWDRANALLQRTAELGFTPDVDLGVRACAADLLVTSRSAHSKDVPRHRTGLVNWDGVASWRPTFYPLPVAGHAGTPDLADHLDEPKIHTRDAGPLALPFALDPADGDTLTVLFHGAIDRGRTRLPIFQRWRFQTEMGAGPTMSIADPTLDLSADLRLAWYLGTEETDMAPIIAETITTAASALGVTSIVLVGNSGGGFAALHVGAHIDDAVVVAMSPQTDLRQYVPRLIRPVYEAAFGRKQDPTTKILTRRISAIERMRATGKVPRTYIVSNTGDDFHVSKHEKPLLEDLATSGHRDRASVLEFDLGSGHRSLSNEQYQAMLGTVYGGL